MFSTAQIHHQAESFVAALDRLLNQPPASVGQLLAPHDIANEIDSAWAVPLLVAAWDKTLSGGGRDEIRPALKEAIHALNKTAGTGGIHDQQRLGDLVISCAISICNRLSKLEEKVPPKEGGAESDELVATMRITGAKLHTAKDVNRLLSGGIRSALKLVTEIISGRLNPAALKGDFPLLSRLPMRPATRDIWYGLYLRLVLPLLLETIDAESTPSLTVSTTPLRWASVIQPSAGAIPVTIDDAQVQDSLSLSEIPRDNVADSQLTAYPLHRAGNGFATSMALILDSISPWLQIQIERHNLREQVISKPFEDEVVEIMRRKKFVAGEVTKGGVWRHGQKSPSVAVSSISKALAATAERHQVGQIDVLAVRADGIFLIECKTMAGTGSPYSLSAKSITGDADDWHATI